MFEIILSARGIFSMGNMYPLSSMVGSIIPNMDVNMADCCEEVTVEINSPRDKAVNISSVLAPKSNIKLPFIGRSNTYTLNNNIAERFIRDNKR